MRTLSRTFTVFAFATSTLAASAILLDAQAVSAQTAGVCDSVGIRIVENSSRLKAPVAFTLGAKPNVDMGGLEDDPDRELSPRNGYPRAIRLTDGRVVIADVARVQFFDKDGKRLRLTGRKGGGPGEFGSVAALCRTRGDTVLASSGVPSRVTVLSQTGEYLSVTTPPAGHFSEREFCLNDGTFLAVQMMPTERGSDGILRLNHVNRAGAVMHMIAEVNTGVFDMAVRRESQYITWGQNVAFGNAIDYEVRVFSANGKLLTIIRTDDKLEPISRSELEKLPPTGARANATAAERADDARRIAASSHTKTWPPYDKLMTDFTGRLWIQDWKPSQTALEPIGWTAFDVNGKLIGRLIIPAPESKEKRQVVVSFGKDEVFIRRLDDDGAAH